jgi:hypothetical protein
LWHRLSEHLLISLSTKFVNKGIGVAADPAIRVTLNKEVFFPMVYSIVIGTQTAIRQK